MANRNLPIAMLYRWFKCKLKPPKKGLINATMTPEELQQFLATDAETQSGRIKNTEVPPPLNRQGQNQ